MIKHLDQYLGKKNKFIKDPIISIIMERMECFISEFIIISFGKNPIKGGKPLIDNINKYIIIINVKFSYLFHRSSIFLLFIILNKVNKGKLIIEYSNK